MAIYWLPSIPGVETEPSLEGKQPTHQRAPDLNMKNASRKMEWDGK